MKTLKTFKEKSHLSDKLLNATVAQFGGWELFKSRAKDVCNHGIDGGFCGFIYYSETVKFSESPQVRKEIIKLLEDTAADLGEDVVSMVAGFGVFRTSPMDSEDKRDLYRYLSEAKCKETTIPNLMAWFAGEEVCRSYVDLLDQ
jgi:hypothetical protein